MRLIALISLLSLAACNKNSSYGTTNVSDRAYFAGKPPEAVDAPAHTFTFTGGDPWKPLLVLEPDGTIIWHKPGEDNPIVVKDQRELVDALRDVVSGVCGKKGKQ